MKDSSRSSPPGPHSVTAGILAPQLRRARLAAGEPSPNCGLVLTYSATRLTKQHAASSGCTGSAEQPSTPLAHFSVAQSPLGKLSPNHTQQPWDRKELITIVSTPGTIPRRQHIGARYTSTQQKVIVTRRSQQRHLAHPSRVRRCEPAPRRRPIRSISGRAEGGGPTSPVHTASVNDDQLPPIK